MEVAPVPKHAQEASSQGKKAADCDGKGGSLSFTTDYQSEWRKEKESLKKVKLLVAAVNEWKSKKGQGVPPNPD